MSGRRLEKIILGSRGSDLARAQTTMVVQALKQAWPGLDVGTEIISTRGDRRAAQAIDPRAGGKGLFTGEIESALAAREIDVAVHSAKDLPSAMTEGLILGAVLPRAPVEDVLITKAAGAAAGAIATGSVRRQHQLRWKKPGVEVVDLRGNVPTRLRQFVRSDWHAIVLARAGLERLGYDLTGEVFEFEGTRLRAEILLPNHFLPAGGQGIVAVQLRAEDDTTNTVVAQINHQDTFRCLEAEREFLRLLQGDCGSPIGVVATITGSTLRIQAQVFEPPRIEPRVARVEGDASAPQKIAAQLWEAING